MHEISFAGMSTDLRQRMKAFGYLGSDSFAAISSRGALFESRAQRAMVREALSLARLELDHEGDIETARALRATAIDLSPAALGPHLLRALDRRLERAATDRGPTSAQLLRGSVTSALVAAKWRIWSYAGVS
jgi:hypothetical protein